MKVKDNPMKTITISHGSGGKLTHKLIQDIFFKSFSNDILNKADDAAELVMDSNRIAFTTDSFVVKPPFFPGGDIGKLSVCGTVNDLAVKGACPKYISAAFIIEEGFMESDLVRIVESMSEWAREAGVAVVAGDTKVVEKREADGIFINTSGIGIIKEGAHLGIDRIRIGDKIIITGTVGDHGIAVLSRRKGIEFGGDVKSDSAPLNKMLMGALDNIKGIRFMRDPTRGGIATTLNEIADKQEFGILINEESIPISSHVRGASELLGLDPLYIANEGKAVIVVDPSSENELLGLLRADKYGRDAKTIGHVTAEHKEKVCLKTRYGVTRIIDMLSGEPIPRIC